MSARPGRLDPVGNRTITLSGPGRCIVDDSVREEVSEGEEGLPTHKVCSSASLRQCKYILNPTTPTAVVKAFQVSVARPLPHPAAARPAKHRASLGGRRNAAALCNIHACFISPRKKVSCFTRLLFDPLRVAAQLNLPHPSTPSLPTVSTFAAASSMRVLSISTSNHPGSR